MKPATVNVPLGGGGVRGGVRVRGRPLVGEPSPPVGPGNPTTTTSDPTTTTTTDDPNDHHRTHRSRRRYAGGPAEPAGALERRRSAPVDGFDFGWTTFNQFPHPTFKGGSAEAYQAFAKVLLAFFDNGDNFDFLTRTASSSST